MKVSTLGKSVAPLGALTAPFGADLSTIIDKTSQAIDSDRGVEVQQKAAQRCSNKNRRPAGPTRALLPFKLVHSTGCIPRIHYLLAYDKKTLLDVLSRTELVGPTPEND